MTTAGSHEEWSDDELNPIRECDRGRDHVSAWRRHTAFLRDHLDRSGRVRSVHPLRLRARQPLAPASPAGGTGRLRAGGLERDVTFGQPDPHVHPDPDAAYHTKYDRYGRAIVGTVVGDKAAAVTLRLLPRSA